jgi:hypothetical protein
MPYYCDHADRMRLALRTIERAWGCLSSHAYKYSITFSFRVIGPKVAV